PGGGDAAGDPAGGPFHGPSPLGAPHHEPPADGLTPDAPAPDSAPQGWLGRRLSGLPTSRPGAPRADTVPRVENVRVTAPDLARRAALRKTRRRLGLAACGF